jgi:hypothetical protein
METHCRISDELRTRLLYLQPCDIFIGTDWLKCRLEHYGFKLEGKTIYFIGKYLYVGTE